MAIWVNLRDVMLSEVRQAQKDKHIPASSSSSLRLNPERYPKKFCLHISLSESCSAVVSWAVIWIL
jgi:hypothetical protein